MNISIKLHIYKNKIHHQLNRIFLFKPFLIILAYLKNDAFKPSVEDMLIKRMLKKWRKLTILDLGSGPCNKERDKRFKSVNITCVEIYTPAVKICHEYGFNTIHADIRYINEYFPPKSIDIIWLLDVIEHFPKKEGLRLLDKMEKIARRQILIWTPLGWVPQDIDYSNNKYQRHLSAWFKSDFEKLNYKCEVIRNYHKDIRNLSKSLSKFSDPVSADALWAIKIFNT